MLSAGRNIAFISLTKIKMGILRFHDRKMIVKSEERKRTLEKEKKEQKVENLYTVS